MVRIEVHRAGQLDAAALGHGVRPARVGQSLLDHAYVVGEPISNINPTGRLVYRETMGFISDRYGRDDGIGRSIDHDNAIVVPLRDIDAVERFVDRQTRQTSK